MTLQAQYNQAVAAHRVALKEVPDWRWFLGRNDSPWYSSMRLFRQPKEGDWAGVFAEMQSQVPQ